MSYPQPFSNRPPQDLRLGIKSSYYNIRNTIALLYCIYLASGKKSEFIYSTKNGDGIQLIDSVSSWLNDYFAEPLINETAEESNLLL